MLNHCHQIQGPGQNMTLAQNATLGQNKFALQNSTSGQNATTGQNVTLKQNSINYVKFVIENRQRSDKEIYLVDVGSRNRTQTEKDFFDLKVDLDDEIYFYSYNNMSGTNKTGLAENSNLEIQFWEVYRIMETMPIIILEYAKWTEQRRIQMAVLDKCKRRRDLKVSKLAN